MKLSDLRRYCQLSYVGTYVKKKRFNKINELLGGVLNESGLKILEVGVNEGKDFMQFVNGSTHFLYGLDPVRCGTVEDIKFEYIKATADEIPFDDKYFDLLLSIGVLEHIVPMENLCASIKEMNRVANRFIHIVPSIGSFFEPHAMSILWPVRDRCLKKPYSGNLFHMSDDAWLQFEGFRGAQTARFSYIPFISCLAIYKK